MHATGKNDPLFQSLVSGLARDKHINPDSFHGDLVALWPSPQPRSSRSPGHSVGVCWVPTAHTPNAPPAPLPVVGRPPLLCSGQRGMDAEFVLSHIQNLGCCSKVSCAAPAGWVARLRSGRIGVVAELVSHVHLLHYCSGLSCAAPTRQVT